jgi:hypothetical protein
MLGSDSGTGGVDSSLNIAGFLSQVGRSPTRDTVKRGVRQSTELCRSEGNNIGARRNYTLLRGGPLSSVKHNRPPHSDDWLPAEGNRTINKDGPSAESHHRADPLARGRRRIRNANWRIVTYSTFSGGASWEPLRGSAHVALPKQASFPLLCAFLLLEGKDKGNKQPIILRRRFNLFQVPICRKTGNLAARTPSLQFRR